VRIEGEIELPHGTMRLVDLASTVLGLSSEVADSGARIAANLGHQVSCRKGCAACCRQPAPLSPPEALMLEELVESLPKHIKTRIQNLFDEAVRQLEDTGLLEQITRLQEPTSVNDEDMHEINKAYFLQQIPCPFLERECCSIYKSRSSRCREYIVTSPAKYCLNPYEQPVYRLPLSIRLSEALARMWAEATQTPLQLVPLTLALEWSAKHKLQKGISADAHQMLDVLLFHVAQIAAEYERKAMNILKGKASSLLEAPY
jgi:Fe-S-cluster containining protein